MGKYGSFFIFSKDQLLFVSQSEVTHISGRKCICNYFVQGHRAIFGLALILGTFLAYGLICGQENIQCVR